MLDNDVVIISGVHTANRSFQWPVY